MSDREDVFKRKFGSAAQHLGVKPHQVISVKLRENVVPYEEYRDLVESLEREAGLECSQLDADLQGRGYLLTDGKTKVIVVEHENGLEVLYIAGSIASLIGLVPLVLQGWYALRGRLFGRRGLDVHSVEVRRMDASGRLQEERMHDCSMGPLTPMSVVGRELMATATQIESELRGLSQRVGALTSRVEALEKHMSPSVRTVTRSKKRVTKPPKKRAGRTEQSRPRQRT